MTERPHCGPFDGASPLRSTREWLNLIYEKGRKLPVCKHPHRWLGYERSHVFAFLTRRKLGGEDFRCNHSFYDWYDRFWEQNPKNPTAFVEKHADWFAQGYPEAKQPPQLCYTNPAVVRQCLADAAENFSLPNEEREKKFPRATNKFWAVVPMDNSSYCKCPNCAKLGPSERVSKGGFPQRRQQQDGLEFCRPGRQRLEEVQS